MSGEAVDLTELGWGQFFAAQLDPVDDAQTDAVRVMAVHRGHLLVTGAQGDFTVPPHMADAPNQPTVGDWLLVDRDTRLPTRVLDRKSLFKRKAPGKVHEIQLIAANIDTLFIVTSCNQDFNIARLERYLVLAREADVTPVIVLTKADLTDDSEVYAAPMRKLMPGLLVEVVNARDPQSVAGLAAWCGRGQTVALLGSSGVGKSTLANTLGGEITIATQAVRESDDKGRHTTTAREIRRLPMGGLLLDTPGMRELQLTDVAGGLEDVFEDIADLSRACKFNDCQHTVEPGCAIKSAIADGTADAARVERWRKLTEEQVRNTETIAERRARNRNFSKMVNEVGRPNRK